MKNSGTKWPYLIGGSILLIIIAAVATVIFALNHPVQLSNDAMQNYHDVDKNANKMIRAKIAFDKLYDIRLDSDISDINNPKISYTLMNKNGEPVNNAEIKLLLTHPFILEFDKEYQANKPTDGVYTFDGVKIAKVGRWNYITLIKIGEDERFHNVKADTRNSNTFEF